MPFYHEQTLIFRNFTRKYPTKPLIIRPVRGSLRYHRANPTRLSHPSIPAGKSGRQTGDGLGREAAGNPGGRHSEHARPPRHRKGVHLRGHQPGGRRRVGIAADVDDPAELEAAGAQHAPHRHLEGQQLVAPRGQQGQHAGARALRGTRARQRQAGPRLPRGGHARSQVFHGGAGLPGSSVEEQDAFQAGVAVSSRRSGVGSR